MAVEVCAICDIAGCRHIREREESSSSELEHLLNSLFEIDRFLSGPFTAEDAICARDEARAAISRSFRQEAPDA